MNHLHLYAAAIGCVLLLYIKRQRRIHTARAAELQNAVAAGLAEPASLHPVVNLMRCIGSGSCAKACPGDALGIVNGKAVLKNTAACIGHGTCLAACPVEAIKLVFGTERRSMDIPHVSPTFESNVPGIYIAGELGGMGLTRKAAEQVRQAVASIRNRVGGQGTDGHDTYDLVIAECGQAGLSAGLSAIHHGLKYKLIVQEESPGGPFTMNRDTKLP